MAWIESHQSLARHRKLLRALHVLRTCDRHKLIGHLHVLWWWGLDSADINGVLGNISPSEVAQAADWDGDADLFFSALLEAGFLDKTETGYQLHDWYSYAGKLMATREKNRERMKAARAAHVHDTFRARAPATVPNRTVPNRTVPSEEPPISPLKGGQSFSKNGRRRKNEPPDPERFFKGEHGHIVQR